MVVTYEMSTYEMSTYEMGFSKMMRLVPVSPLLSSYNDNCARELATFHLNNETLMEKFCP